MEGIELNVFLPKLATNISQDINNILRVKEQLLKESTGAYPIETLRDVTAKIINYLKNNYHYQLISSLYQVYHYN